jgi:hypothetical protein
MCLDDVTKITKTLRIASRTQLVICAHQQSTQYMDYNYIYYLVPMFQPQSASSISYHSTKVLTILRMFQIHLKNVFVWVNM